MAVVIGVDLSTQSTTVAVRDATTLRPRGRGSVAHPPTTPPVSEQHPDDWWAAFTLALARGLSDAGVDPDEVAAIGVGAQCHGAVLLDGHDRPLRSVKLWNDTTSAPQAEQMVAEFGTATWAQQVGSVPTAAFTITKLAWIAEHEPSLLSGATSVLLPHDWLTYRLTGRRVTDRSDASGTGYYSAHQKRWRPDLLERFVSDRVDWSAMLPEVMEPNASVGTLRPDVAAELGLRASTQVSAGGGDQHLGAVGLGMEPGDIAYSLGTSGVVLAPADAPVLDSTGVVNGVASATGGYLPLACTLNATKVTDWAAQLLGVSVGELGELALGADNPSRPVFATYLDGERTPDLPHATGILAGLTTATSRADIARSAFEGVVLGLTDAHRSIVAAGVETDGRVLTIGGGARGLAYRQILADALGRTVVVPDVDEATARGAAVQAKAVLEGETVATVAREHRPPAQAIVPARASLPDELRERYRTVATWRGADRGTDTESETS